MASPRAGEHNEPPASLRELFSTAVLTSTLVKALALAMLCSLLWDLPWTSPLSWAGLALLVLLFGAAAYGLEAKLLRVAPRSVPADLAYAVFSLALVFIVLLLARQYFSHLNALLFFPVVISALLLGRRGLVTAFAGVFLILLLDLLYQVQTTSWYLADNILTAAVMLFVAWLVGEATELNRRTTWSLSEHSHLLQTVLDALPAGILTQDHEGRVISANRYLRRLVGAGATPGETGTGGGPADNRLEAIRELAADPESPVQTGEIVGPDGAAVPVKVSRHPVALYDRHVQVILVQDLSDREKLRELDLMLRRVLEDWEVGVVFLDGDNRVRVHNEAARKYLRLGPDIDGSDGNDILQRVQESVTAAGGRPEGTRTPEAAFDGRYLLVNRTTWPKSPDGRPWTVITVHDLTERRKAELELQRARSLSSLGQVAAGVAHELRNPLASIKGFAQLAGEQEDVGRIKQHLDIIRREAGHMQEILDRFLLMSRPSRPARRVVDLRETVITVWELLYSDSLRRRIRLEKELPPDVLIAEVDPQLIRQVLLNLVTNALEATPAGGTVRLTAGASAGEVHLTVSDTGSGIPPQLLDDIFTPFFTTKDDGTGLGLSICNEMVKNHGGTLKVESSEAGSSFRVILPLIRPEQAGSAVLS
ncbi:MAG: ATP-binding protein [Bacillota bacterium]